MRVRGRPLYAPEQPRAHPLGALTTPPRRPSVVRPGHNVVISRSGGRSLGSRAARHQHRDEPRRRPWPDQLAENFFARWDGATARPGAANGAHRLQQSARHCCTRLDPSWLPAARRSRRLSEPAGRTASTPVDARSALCLPMRPPTCPSAFAKVPHYGDPRISSR